MEIVLALAAAGLVGSGDFFGGLASRRGRVFAVALWVHLIGVGALILVAPLLGGTPGQADWLWGALAGGAAGLGIISLYHGFARGRIGVVAPVSAISAAALPLLFGFVTGERPRFLEWLGLLVGLVAIGLVSTGHEADASGPILGGVLYGVGAGLGFAVLYIALAQTSPESGIWPLLPARIAGSMVVALVALFLGRKLVPVKASWRPVVATGILSILGNFAFILATREGLLSIVAVLTSLYPAATVLLARLVLHERLSRVQLAGFALAIAAVTLIAV